MKQITLGLWIRGPFMLSSQQALIECFHFISTIRRKNLSGGVIITFDLFYLWKFLDLLGLLNR